MAIILETNKGIGIMILNLRYLDSKPDRASITEPKQFVFTCHGQVFCKIADYRQYEGGYHDYLCQSDPQEDNIPYRQGYLAGIVDATKS